MTGSVSRREGVRRVSIWSFVTSTSCNARQSSNQKFMPHSGGLSQLT